MIKIHINNDIYASVTAEYVTLVSKETDQVILNIPSYTLTRLHALQEVLISQGIQED